jgi:hypothetical protein
MTDDLPGECECEHGLARALQFVEPGPIHDGLADELRVRHSV